MRLNRSENGAVLMPKRVCAALLKEAELSGHDECCGLILGESGQITAIAPARNVHPAPKTRFEIDPQTLVDAHRAERAGGPQVLGYYHSHPLGSSLPSDTDRANAPRDGRVWAIIGYDGLRFWEDAEDGFRALSYEVVER